MSTWEDECLWEEEYPWKEECLWQEKCPREEKCILPSTSKKTTFASCKKLSAILALSSMTIVASKWVIEEPEEHNGPPWAIPCIILWVPAGRFTYRVRYGSRGQYMFVDPTRASLLFSGPARNEWLNSLKIETESLRREADGQRRTWR